MTRAPPSTGGARRFEPIERLHEPGRLLLGLATGSRNHVHQVTDGRLIEGHVQWLLRPATGFGR